MKAYVFPGQGAQFVGMGKDLYEKHPIAKQFFEKANEILGFRITDIMFSGTDEELKQTKVTQPAMFLHSVVSALCQGPDFQPAMVAGHSLGELSALTAARCLSFEDGLRLVAARARAMQNFHSALAKLYGIVDVVGQGAQSLVGTHAAEVGLRTEAQLLFAHLGRGCWIDEVERCRPRWGG